MISDISTKDVGKDISIKAKVNAVKYGERTEFELKDATGSIKATFRGDFPKIGETLILNAIVKSRNNIIELEVLSHERGFLIDSEKLDLMKQEFLKAMKLLKSEQYIMIRHHDDVDGYAAGIALESSLSSLGGYVTRNDSRTPFYDYGDALRDLNTYYLLKSRKEIKPPLVVLLDLGSNFQSIKAINRLRLHGFSFMIIDHHRFDYANKESSICFINPLFYGFDSSLTAGALASELALMINPNADIKHFPALSCIADKSEGKEVEQYLSLSRYTKDYLEKWSLVIDHELFHLRFQPSQDVLNNLFFESEENKKIINQISVLVEAEINEMQKAVTNHIQKIRYRNFTLLKLDKYMLSGYWGYASSKLSRIVHNLGEGNRVSFVFTEDSISFRAENVKGFSVVGFMDILKQEIPGILIEGGGHDNAGSIRFNPGVGSKVEHVLSKYLEKLDCEGSR